MDSEKSDEDREFNVETIKKLKSLLGTLEKSPISTCSLVQSGENFVSFNVSDKSICGSWIIDSGATDHMTNSSNLFCTYTPCPSSRKISVADGSLTTVAGLGDVKLSPEFNLRQVLHVPKLISNLISIQKLTKDMNCCVTFFPSYCEF